ncbi:Transcription repressor like [Quillaja saponaria]|uniref:Transcription repressor n=1 Tax=Quillaja saponaria TaxID=32244 RepID=A0AAD7VLG6_QUISA|nr:Transcription repressor like [Quillaja saponaria]
MHSPFWKQFQLCCFKFKHPTTTTTNANLSQPLNPKQEHHVNNSSSTLASSSTSIIINNNNFNLYDVTSSSDHHSSTTTSDFFTSSDDNSDLWDPPDLATVFASKRFFFSAPGHSNSIIESPETQPLLHQNTNTNNNYNKLVIPTGGVKVPKYSINPYVDFRRSMQEMVESRQVKVDMRNDWEYLHELLLCYLAMNPTHTHKYIVRAFTDLVVSLLSSSSSSSSSSTKRQCRISSAIGM